MRIIFFIFISIFCLLSSNSSVFAQESTQVLPIYKQEFYKAKVNAILEDGHKDMGEILVPYQKLELELSGDIADKKIVLDTLGRSQFSDDKKIKKGDILILYRTSIDGETTDFQISDKYRSGEVIYLAIAFVALVLLVGRLRGFGSIIGLCITFLVIFFYIVPQILKGKDPVVESIVGSSIIIFTSIYLSHGFSKKTTIAIISTVITLILTGLLAAFSVDFTNLSGIGNDLAQGFNLNPTLGEINLKGLLLGGMIIGSLGVLDDVTTTQSAAIFELIKANPTLKFTQLLEKGFNIGKDHISSVVNTLVLAYTGASFPVLLFIVLNPTNQPLWVMLNSEPIMEEIVRTLVGSMGLVLSVPITTVLASWFVTRNVKK